jgi:hypothetical protein
MLIYLYQALIKSGKNTMKNIVIALIASVIICDPLFLLYAKDSESSEAVSAQEEEDFLGEAEDVVDGDDGKKRLKEERKKREEEEQKAEEAKRIAIKKRQLKERKVEESKAKELDALRESSADTTEYTLDPSSVELVVEMDPNGYGFRTRSHRMSMSADIDLVLRGRAMLHYDYRFSNYLSLGILAGLDSSDISLYSRFRDDFTKRSPKQIAVLSGLSTKWRLSEWYMKSAFFLEPSFLLGHMWQTFASINTTHWRLRPGLFGGVETVFDSGLTLSTKVGVELALDVGSENPIYDGAEPLLVVSFGFAI